MRDIERTTQVDVEAGTTTWIVSLNPGQPRRLPRSGTKATLCAKLLAFDGPILSKE